MSRINVFGPRMGKGMRLGHLAAFFFELYWHTLRGHTIMTHIRLDAQRKELYCRCGGTFIVYNEGHRGDAYVEQSTCPGGQHLMRMRRRWDGRRGTQIPEARLRG